MLRIMSSIKLRLSSLIGILICVTATHAYGSGLVKVIPPEEDLLVGNNVTLYCMINRTLSDRTAEEIQWNKGYPPFAFGSRNPLPESWQTVVNDTTKSLTLQNLTISDTDYYYCYLSKETNLENTDNSNVHVMRAPRHLENLTCSAISRHSFYCFWEPMDEYTAYQNTVEANFYDPYDSTNQDRMEVCNYEVLTPLVTEGYDSMCVEATSYYRVTVSVIITNPVGTATTNKTFYIPAIAQPLPLELIDDDVRVDTNSIRLTLDIPYKWDENEIDYLTYIVEYATYESEDWVTATKLSHQVFLMMSLHPHTEYKVRAKTKTEEHTQSDWSNTLRVETLSFKPTSPVDSLHVQMSHTNLDKRTRNVQVAWQGLQENQKGDDDFKYFVELMDTIGQIVQSYSTVETNYIFLSISRFLAYNVRVFPGNRVGNGSIVQTSIHDQSGVPGKPDHLVWSKGNLTAGWLQWDDPEEPNCIIQKFIVRWQEKGYNAPINEYEVIKTEGKESFHHTITYLKTFVTYEFSVCSVSLSTGEFGPYSTASGTTKEGIPEQAPAGLGVEPENAHALKLSWMEPNGKHYGNIIYYNISYCPLDAANNCLEEHMASYHSHGATLTYTLTGLESYTRYGLSVCAVTNGGAGPYSTVAGETIQGTPQPPTNLRSTGVSSHSIGIAWDAPEKLNGLLKYYLVEYSSDETVMSSQYESRKATLKVYGNTKYAINVKACSYAVNQHCSELSNTLSISTPVGEPSHPMEVTTSQIGYDTITLLWKEPAHPNGIITHYVVEYRRSDTTNWVLYNGRINKTSETLKLDCPDGAKVTYDFAISAVNSEYQSVAAELHEREMCDTYFSVNAIMTVVILPTAAILAVICIIFLIKYHRKVKRNLPDPYFIDAVKNSIYGGQQSWTYNENQFFIVERESFDTLRCVDDSTQLLGLDRMYSTEGSTSSSDQGIHDMDSHLTSSTGDRCSKLIPEKTAKVAEKDDPTDLAEDFSKDVELHADDAVFPEDTDNYGDSDCVIASLSYAGVSISGTPPNSPASPAKSTNSSERIDSGNVSCCSDATKYAKIADGQLSPLSTLDNSSRPLSSASEDSISYMRLHQSQPNSSSTNTEMVNPNPIQDMPEVVFNPDIDPKEVIPSECDQICPSGDDDESSVRITEDQPMSAEPKNQSMITSPGTPKKQQQLGKEESKLWPPSSSASSSSDDVSGYCKQDNCDGAAEPVSSSGLSSVGEEYSRIAHNNNEGDPSLPVVQVESPAYPKQPPPAYSIKDPYVTSQQMKAKEEQLQQTTTLPTPGITDCINNNYVAPAQAM